ncbi:MAG: hypothetical protein FWF15_00590 [Oscillospiraceae bacterium]|nr:hypothetical protein [Oscillospiraceae bacterium]
MKKVSLLIVICMLFAIIACGASNESVNETKSTAETTAAETADPNYSVFPKVNMEGREFIILMPDYFIGWQFNQEAENGEPLNDAAYRRNTEIEDQFNITIRARGVTDDNCHKELLKLVQSGDDSVDLVLPHPTSGNGYPPLITDGLLLEWSNLKYIDFSKPCWNLDMQKSLTIAGKLMYANGALSTANAAIIAWNKSFAHDLGRTEDLYKLALNGTWTMDKLIEYTKDVYIDVNGDGKEDKFDIYGYMANSSEYSYLYSGGVKVARVNSEGRPELTFMDDRLATIFDKVYTLVNNYGSFKHPNVYESWDHFGTGGALTTPWDSGYSQLFRPMEFDLGILPYPKLDEIQENYYNCTAGGIVAVPINAKDIDNLSIIIQALMEGSYKYVRPTYIDTVLYNKCLRDDESRQIMEMIMDSLVYDIGFTFMVDKSLTYIINSLILDKNSKDFVSYYESRKDKIQKELDNLYEAVIALDTKD